MPVVKRLWHVQDWDWKPLFYGKCGQYCPDALQSQCRRFFQGTSGKRNRCSRRRNGKNIDKTFIQSKMLNVSKGPAVHSLRAQADKAEYSRAMRKVLEIRITLPSSRQRSVKFCGKRKKIRTQRSLRKSDRCGYLFGSRL